MIAGIGKLYRGANEVTKVYLGTKVVYNSAVPIDPDARAYLDAISPFYSATWFDDILKTEEQFELDTSDMFIALKDNGLYALLKAFYPFSGGTADSNKINAKDPRNLDAAFRLSFFGSPTHNYLGTTYNGTTQYDNMHLNPFVELSFTDNQVSFYSRTAGAAGYDIGASEDSGAIVNELALIARYYLGNPDLAFYSVDDFYNLTPANSDGRGFYIGTKTGAMQKLWKNNTLLGNRNSIGSQLPNRDLYGQAINLNGAPGFFAARNICFRSVGGGLSDAEVGIFTNIVNTAQINQNRAI